MVKSGPRTAGGKARVGRNNALKYYRLRATSICSLERMSGPSAGWSGVVAALGPKDEIAR